MKRTIVILLAVVVVAAGVFVGYRKIKANAANSTSKVQTSQVTRGDLQATVASSGAVQSAQSLDLSFGIAGTITSIQVKRGQNVAAGDALAKVDDSALAAQVSSAKAALSSAQAKLQQLKDPPAADDVAVAQANLDNAKASYDVAKAKAGTVGDQMAVAQAALDKAEKAVQDAQAAYDRVSWRPDIGRLPQASTLQQATIDLQTAKANFNVTVAGITDTGLKSAAAQLASAQASLDKLVAGSAQADLDVAQAGVDQAKVALDTANKNLTSATLTAPFAGTVTDVPVIVGQTVGAATVAVSLADLTHLQVQVSLAEVDVPKAKADQSASVTLDAIPDAKLTGKVSDIAIVGKTTQGVVNYPVTVSLDPTKVAVKPGMSASVTIVVDERTNVLLVPNRAIHSATGQGSRNSTYYVDVLVEGQSVQVPVTIGLSNGSLTEVSGSTLREGDAVVITRTTTATGGAGGRIGGLLTGGGGGIPVAGR
jgi:HlyD family secretion protein